METFDSVKMNKEIISEIIRVKNEKLDELKNEGVFLNEVLREDILPLLDRYCTVIYYPTDDKDNNGFHKIYLVNGVKIHFVYINTNQHREKQIFTAAHELGHVWKLDEHFSNILGDEYSYEYCERIMNRFAAELLMPESIFRSYVEALFRKATYDHGKLPLFSVIQMITTVMNEFFVPYKSVLYRLYELDYIDVNSARMLWGEPQAPRREIIEHLSKKYAYSQGYTRLYNEDRLKMIDGLKESLDKARKANALPREWLEEFYRKFGLEEEDPNEALYKKIEIAKGEGSDAVDTEGSNR